MNDLPLISIVTPTLNQSRYIKTTIESVISQEYPYLEYLVIDGGSTDGTREILNDYREVISCRLEPGLRQSKAINLGWRETSGEIISWINSDDVNSPGTLVKIGEIFQQRPEVDMVYGDCDYIDANGGYLRPYPTRDFDYLALLSKAENYIPQPATFLRRRVLDKVGFLDENLEYIMDFEFWLRVGRSCKVEHCSEKLAAMRLHPQAKSIAMLSGFAKELVRVYKDYFSDKNLSSTLRKLEKEAMANSYTRAADCAFWGNDHSLARDMLVASWKYRIWPPRGLWFWVALGKIGRSIINVLYKNPYFP